LNIFRTKNGGKVACNFVCEDCDYSTSKKYNYDKHILTAKHRIRTVLEPPDGDNVATSFECVTCNYVFKCQSDLHRHMLTNKHINAKKTGKKREKVANKQPDTILDVQSEHKIICKCGKTYTSRSSLWYHKKQCPISNIDSSEKSLEKTSVHVSALPPENIVHNTSETDHIMQCVQSMLVTNNQNAEIIATLVEAQAQTAAREEAHAAHAAAREEAHAAHAAEQTRLFVDAISLKGPQCITNNNNTTNNQFNLNVFLNEDCKDAFTLKEVVDSIECTVMDLDRMDKDGYVATITRKILESMQHMSITERPIHCTDARRNTVCVKSDDGWEQNEAAMKRLNDTVYRMGGKMGRMVDDWRIAYPDHFRGTVSRREQYHRLISDIIKVGDLDIEARIASKICKGVVLDRKVAMDR
jgi:hypothetical protein